MSKQVQTLEQALEENLKEKNPEESLELTGVVAYRVISLLGLRDMSWEAFGDRCVCGHTVKIGDRLRECDRDKGHDGPHAEVFTSAYERDGFLCYNKDPNQMSVWNHVGGNRED